MTRSARSSMSSVLVVNAESGIAANRSASARNVLKTAYSAASRRSVISARIGSIIERSCSMPMWKRKTLAASEPMCCSASACTRSSSPTDAARASSSRRHSASTRPGAIFRRATRKPPSSRAYKRPIATPGLTGIPSSLSMHSRRPDRPTLRQPTVPDAGDGQSRSGRPRPDRPPPAAVLRVARGPAHENRIGRPTAHLSHPSGRPRLPVGAPRDQVLTPGVLAWGLGVGGLTWVGWGAAIAGRRFADVSRIAIDAARTASPPDAIIRIATEGPDRSPLAARWPCQADLIEPPRPPATLHVDGDGVDATR